MESTSQEEGSSRSPRSSPRSSRTRQSASAPKIIVEGKPASTTQLDHSELFKPLPTTPLPVPVRASETVSDSVRPKGIERWSSCPVKERGGFSALAQPQRSRNCIQPQRPASRSPPQRPVSGSPPQRPASRSPPQKIPTLPRSPPQKIASLTRELVTSLSVESYLPRLSSHSPSSPTKKAATGSKHEKPGEQQQPSPREWGRQDAVISSSPPPLSVGRIGSWTRRSLEIKIGSPPRRRLEKQDREDTALSSSPPSLSIGRMGSWSRSTDAKVGSPPRRRLSSGVRRNTFVSYLDGPLDADAVESELASVSGLAS